MPVLIRNSTALIEALHLAQRPTVYELWNWTASEKPPQDVLLQRLVKGKRIMDCTPPSSWKTYRESDQAGWSLELSWVQYLGQINRLRARAQLSGVETKVCSINTVWCMLWSHFLSQALNIWKLVEKSLLRQDYSTSVCLQLSHRISTLLRPSFTASFLLQISIEISVKHEAAVYP